MTPPYWDQASADLAAGDERMGELVERYAGLGLVSRGDPRDREALLGPFEGLEAEAMALLFSLTLRSSGQSKPRRPMDGTNSGGPAIMEPEAL